MTHSVTCKLNNPARPHKTANGTIFFVSLGEANYNRETKQKEYTNYDAALFAKDEQLDFYTKVLVKDAIIEVSGKGIIIKIDPTGQYKPKLELVDAVLGYAYSPQSQPLMQQAQQMQQQAPQQQAPQQMQQPPQYQPPQQAYQQPPNFIDSEIPGF